MLRHHSSEKAIIKRYLLREISVEEALIEISLVNLSAPRIEDIRNAMQDPSGLPIALSLNQTIFEQIESWRNRPIEGKHPYLYVDGFVLTRIWAGEVHNVPLLVAISVNREGYHQILGIVEGTRESKVGWNGLLGHLKDRGLEGVELIVSDAQPGLVESAASHFSEARWQRCVARWCRSVISRVPSGSMPEAASMLRAIHTSGNRQAAQRNATEVIARLHEMGFTAAAEIAENGVDGTLAYYAFPKQHWRRIRTNSPLEHIVREIRRRARIVGTFPDGKFALSLAAAKLKHIAGTRWSTKRYMSIKPPGK